MPSTNGLLGQMDRNCDDSGAARPDREPLMNGEMVEQSLDGVTDVSQSVIETPKKGDERRRKGTEPENGTSMDDGGMDHKVGVCYGLLCIRYFVISIFLIQQVCMRERKKKRELWVLLLGAYFPVSHRGSLNRLTCSACSSCVICW